ncbi:copper chaperone CopZ [Gracilibacillus kekensis]|uniref:Copper chaperone CopZ n=1 Tax=Gracilibacillus kekensis TaxID=1027249 RepID=A0A1M7IFG3_9BACI|nr:copper chaperone CopZ [Gracilibacillus kekensis]SHM39522.1 copper chaperone [Gracilibacillus kekensis]
MQQKTLEVQGMTCGHCKASVEGALNDLSGVSQVEVNLDNGKVDITYDDTKVTIKEMQEAVEEQGYEVV